MPVSQQTNWLQLLRRGLTDLWFLFTLCAALLLFITLAGYQSGDPGWSSSGQNAQATHILGLSGAYLADALLSLFGYSAYLFPIVLLVFGWQSIRRDSLDAEMFGWKLLGAFAGLFALSGLFALHWPMTINPLSVTAGGLLGQRLSIELLNFWPLLAVTGLYTLFLLLGLSILFDIQWLEVFAWIGRMPLALGAALITLLHKQRRARTSRGEQAVVSEETLQAEADPPDEPVLPLEWEDYKADPQQTVPPAGSAYDGQDDPAERGGCADPMDIPLSTLPVGDTASETEPPLDPLQDDLAEQGDDADWFLAAEDEPLPGTTLRPGDPYVSRDELKLSEEYQVGVAATEGIPAASPQREQDAAASAHPRVKLAVPRSSTTSANSASVSQPYHKPGLELLSLAPVSRQSYSATEIEAMKEKVETALRNYRIDVHVVNVAIGPVVTRLELDLAPGIKVSQVSNLDKDIARSLAVPSVRVVQVIPGKPYIGLEIPNRKREIVHLRSVLESSAYQNQHSPLTLVLGGDIAGQPVVANLGKMPHLLVAGTTGSGKSVAINIMLTSMLYKATPEELKLILIDPKTLEMAMYADIPHLLTPVVTDMNDAENALRWAVAEMERRYQLMAAMKVRSIDGFNTQLRHKIAAGERVDDPLWRAEDHLGIAHQPPQLKPLPYIVIVIDELADMMMAVGKKVEELIARIAQKARAAGIHLILATQRPSVDVITGLIKANIPTRIAFQVSSKIDSRTIIDQQGAESLLGYGDMLFVPPGSAAPQRVHGAFIDDKEVDRVTSYLKTQGSPEYEEGITSPVAPEDMGAFGASEKSDDAENDPLYDEAVALVIEHGKASISWLQRRLSIGYNRSARIIEAMEIAGIVSSPDHGGGARKVLVERREDDF